MDLSPWTYWWVAAGIAVAVELATGTFYLLMLALGFAAGAVAAHLGLSGSGQVAVAALVGGGATALWHWQRARQPAPLPVAGNRDVNLDVSDHVQVERWSDDRTTQVQHRGSTWSARLAPGAEPAPGRHVIVAVEGNWLVLAPAPRH